ncbi:chitooligosaccharide deacetylase [Mangrovihabitans endophyticus]|uniref:Chitooligosaccharide deacetylase n=2 Tax=Mangrovihabitans endophyticus TaxID=1751298 RepID=A0A8J3BYT5_9ACTN|nr:chitooligosaccharide deacetylase [Mangrovihabitans endophyticus]
MRRAAARLVPGDVLWYVDTDAPRFALTFDDGPDPHTTPGLLGVLARHRARATFFLIGERVAAHPDLARAIAGAGHELGNHLLRDERSAQSPPERFARELARTGALLGAYGPVRWFRPGGGWFTPGMLRTAARQDLRAVLGTWAAAHDGGPGDARIADRLAPGVCPGSIVVLHEGTAARRGVVATTDDLLTRLAGRGLSSVTVSELAASAHR